MDASEMKELLQGYLGELDWSGGATKDELLGHLAGRDDTLVMMVNQYVSEGSYADLDAVLSVIPAQAWQDAQGDRWRGARDLDADAGESAFRDGPVGSDTRDVYHAGGPLPATPGFGDVVASGATGDTEPSPEGAAPQLLADRAGSALATADGMTDKARVMPTKVHGMLDYALGAVFVASPWLLGFARDPRARNVVVAAEAGTVLYSLLTDYELGIARRLPMRTHLTLDVALGALLAASPWLLGFSGRHRRPHLLIGLTSIGAGLLTRTTPSDRAGA